MNIWLPCLQYSWDKEHEQLTRTQSLSFYCSYFAVLTTAVGYNYTLLQLHKITKLLKCDSSQLLFRFDIYNRYFNQLNI